VEGWGYVESDGHHLAYRVRDGAPGRDLVVFTPGGTVPMDHLERDRNGARLLDGLDALGRVVLFDRRGIGMSDPIADWSRPLVEQWADDLALIARLVCGVPPVVLSLGDYWGPARLFAASHPEDLTGLVLYEPTGPTWAVDLTESVSTHAGLAELDEADLIARVCPSRADDRSFREWFDVAGRTGASPGVAARLYDRPNDDCVRRLIAAQSRIEVATLVLRRPDNLVGSPDEPDPVASAIRFGVRVDLPGRDYHWLGDEIDVLVAEISRFVVGKPLAPAPIRELRAVMFTDLVGSTDQLSAVGDARWRTTLDRHDAQVLTDVARHGGLVVKTTGDGVVATFASVDHALRAAEAIRDRLEGEELAVRIGVHVGDVEHRGSDISGVAVHVAARVMALSGPNEILTTTSVKLAATGSSHDFEPIGRRSLKGVTGTWMIYRDTTASRPTKHGEPPIT
jgi:class 3 adenylate cyclase/pimeloyl-ACP methyl ester carboxylesterase